MKKNGKFLGAVLAACMAVQCAGTLPVMALDSNGMLHTMLNYAESTEYDTTPCDCGYATPIWITAAPKKDWSSTRVNTFSLLLIDIGAYSSGMNDSGKDYALDDVFFTSLEAVLRSARLNGVTTGIRFRYDSVGTKNPEPADFSMVLSHISQLSESGLLEEYADVIGFVESGFVGCYGEQWGGKYVDLESKAALLDALLEAVPSDIPVTVRTPNTFRKWLTDYCGVKDVSEDSMQYTIADSVLAEKAARVGMYNDGYMGSPSDLGTYSNREAETEWLRTAPAYGGEFSGDHALRIQSGTWLPETALPEMYRTQLTRINGNIYRRHQEKKNFSTEKEANAKLEEIQALYAAANLSEYDYHGSVVKNADSGYTAQWDWIGYDDFEFDEALDNALNLKTDNSAFYGQTVWQFIRAHLGYRYVLRSAKVSAEVSAGKQLDIEISVENTGFSECPGDKEVELLLSNGRNVYAYTTSINPKNWESASTSTESISVVLPSAMTGGKWDVYLRISNPNEDSELDTRFTTKFSNQELQYDETLAANYVGSVKINGMAADENPEYPDVRPASFWMEAAPEKVDAEAAFSFLDRGYTFTESGHYGFTMLFRVDGVTKPMQLGKWCAEWSTETDTYSSLYTTYGLNTYNMEISSDGVYALYVPFFGAAFNCKEASTAEKTKLISLTFNDARNYYSPDTKTILNGNTNVTITPVGIIEGLLTGYDVTFQLAEDAVNFQNFSEKNLDVLSQDIRTEAVTTALSLLEQKNPESYTENGIVYKFSGFTTRRDDKTCLIDENFPAIGEIELYPFYEPDRENTDLNRTRFRLVNNVDTQGIRYVLDSSAMTATVGESSGWQNSSGLGHGGSITIPAYVEDETGIYKVIGISNNAFGYEKKLSDVFIPSTVQRIGTNVANKRTTLYFYEGNLNGQIFANVAKDSYTIEFIPDFQMIPGDVNCDRAVTTADAVTLNRWLLGEEIYAGSLESDLDGNKIMNAFDLALLKKLLIQ